MAKVLLTSTTWKCASPWHDYLPDLELIEELINVRLDGLSALQRSVFVFVLRYLDGLEVAAIGARLSVAIKGVKRELAHALHALHVLVWGVA
ncbi:hypothetical protein [uncultured Sphingomonas sp.]|uniref:RNA polymerase sigma factor n=1 Tax=uncultured Sphingomonas sp. TaxID=158754 RepID=UPI0025EB8F79|nr:hypothetical protein [uncultured Sphingomonas sp.]